MYMTNKYFFSFEDDWRQLLNHFVNDSELHAKWLNTLSYLENCGARKIAACEHPTKVKEEILKHAAEEFRHAHYLKSQITRVTDKKLENFSDMNMLGGFATLHYLQALDIFTCQYLKKRVKMGPEEVREAAYILVTYAIELRASELYPIYHDILKQSGSKVTVKSILLEEEEHLADMQKELRMIKDGEQLLEIVCEYESELCHKWIKAL